MAIDLKRLGLDKSSYGDYFSNAYALADVNKQYGDALIDITNSNSQQQKLIDEAVIGSRRQARGLLDLSKDKPQQGSERAGLRKRRQGLQRHQYQRHQLKS